ncbi:MAG TPA: (2Fe-2S)-binding protein, partial [Anaerolineaceae bacterium]|nr:(2Fe-2S)-binding protein [Anaerolineaceae bacterium]
DPCSALCGRGLIFIDKTDIRHVPTFIGDPSSCKDCERCVAGCPGLAITLVDSRNNAEMPVVTIPYEFTRETIQQRDEVVVEDTEGHELGKFEVVNVHSRPFTDRTLIVQVQAPKSIASKIAGIRVQESSITRPLDQYVEHITDDTIICRCERVTAGEIRSLIRQGYRDMNELKIVTRAGMGSCGAKTCNTMIHRLFLEQGISMGEIADHTKRPLFIEVPLGIFAGASAESEGDK